MYSTLDVRISAEARAFLRAVRHAGGSTIIEGDQLELANACAAADLLIFGTIAPEKAKAAVALTGKAYAYLDRMMRAH